MNICPNCGVRNALKIRNTRALKDVGRVRFYVCEACEYRYKTFEKIIQVKGWDDRKYKPVEGAEVIPEWAFCTK